MNRFLVMRRLLVPAAILAGAVAASCLFLLWQVHRVTDPDRVVEAVGETVASLIRYEEVTFRATDGVELAGLHFPGRAGAPAVLLCHDSGGGKASLVNLAVSLQQAGFHVLAFDFRGHGGSRGGGTTFGISEARDILGAVRYLASDTGEGETPPDRFGVYGIGTGAHAAVLAAREEPVIRTLVLDGLYPDAGWRLRRELFGNMDAVGRLLATPAEVSFNLWHRTRIRAHQASKVLPLLTGRDILLIAPSGDHRLADQVRTLYASIPEQRNADGNMVVLPSPGSGALFGESLDLYRSKIVEFFTGRMGERLP